MTDSHTRGARIFLCYARRDLQLVQDLYDKLREAGHSPWMDKKDILPGENWKHALRSNIKRSDFFLVCISANSTNRRGMIQVEIREALEVWQEKLLDDIYIVPVRFDDCPVPSQLAEFQWVDLDTADGFTKLLRALRVGLAKLAPSHNGTANWDVAAATSAKASKKQQRVSIRKVATLAVALTVVVIGSVLLVSHLWESPYMGYGAVDAVLRKHDLYDRSRNDAGRGLDNRFAVIELDGMATVADSTTGLLWQQSGCSELLPYEEALVYLQQLNRDRVAGRNQWRLPTLFEAMSLVERELLLPGPRPLHIDSVFDAVQTMIWTSDQYNEALAWVVNFQTGTCFPLLITADFTHVRAVCELRI